MFNPIRKLKMVNYRRSHTYNLKDSSLTYFSCNFADNLKKDNLENNIKTKSDDIVETSFDTTLCNALKVMVDTENKIKTEKLDNIEINVSVAIGHINLSIGKKILLE